MVQTSSRITHTSFEVQPMSEQDLPYSKSLIFVIFVFFSKYATHLNILRPKTELLKATLQVKVSSFSLKLEKNLDLLDENVMSF